MKLVVIVFDKYENADRREFDLYNDDFRVRQVETFLFTDFILTQSLLPHFSRFEMFKIDE